MSIQGKTILLGICGGIAAYKAAALCSKLKQAGADVHVIMTESAAKFIAPLTLQALSGNHVTMDTFEERDPSVVSHIDLADRADLAIIAPATANMLAKMAHGLADDMLSTTLLALTAPIYVAPAMNVHMYGHPAVQANIRVLAERGVRFIEPGEGQLACGYVGKGRLAEPEEILSHVAVHFRSNGSWKGLRVLVTAGGTVERIDPVRYLTNDSSGKMGISIARAARDLGAEVTLVAARTTEALPENMSIVRATSAQDMFREVTERYGETDLVIMAAAVADYSVVEQAAQKIKKKDETMTLELRKNPDILKTLGERKGAQFLVGFAAETHDLEKYALEKAKVKNCDLLVANDVSKPGSGFGTDTNEVLVYDQNGLVRHIPQTGKRQVADQLLELISERLRTKGDRPCTPV